MKQSLQKSIVLSALGVMAYLSMSYSYGPGGSAGDRTGSPMGSYQTCSSTSGCHTVTGAFTPSTTIQVLSGSTPVSSYAPSTAYTVRVTVSSSTSVTSNTRYSFQIVCVQASTYNAVNNWGTPPSGTHSVTVSGRAYIEHTTQLTSGTINIPWTSPATSTGNVIFYCTGNVVNNNFSETGDNCISTSLTLPPATSGCTPPTLSTTVGNILCNGDSTGSINLFTSGGTSPFTYAWTGPSGYQSASQNLTGLKAGNYSVTVTATGGCTATTNATVNEPTTKLVTSTASNTPLCAGNSLNLSSSSSGGTGAYTYSWTGPSSYTNSNSSGVLTSVTTSMSGKYILTVHDANGCTAKDTENVIINTKPNADSINANAASSQTFNFLAINAVNNPKYNWDFGDGKTDTNIAPSHTFTTTGSYTVRLILSNSCGNDTLYKQLYIALTGIEKNSIYLSTINIYPNPAKTFAQVISNPDVIIYNVKVYSIQGLLVREVAGNTNNKCVINTAHLSSGIYLLHLETNKGNTIRKLQIE